MVAIRKESDTEGEAGSSERRRGGLRIGDIGDRDWRQDVDVRGAAFSGELLILYGCCGNGRLRVMGAAFRDRLMKGSVSCAVVAGVLLRRSVEETGRSWKQKREKTEKCSDGAKISRIRRCVAHRYFRGVRISAPLMSV